MNNKNFDVKLLSDLLKSHSMQNYFQTLTASHLRDKIATNNDSKIKIADYSEIQIPILRECSNDEFFTSINNVFATKFIVNEFQTEILISIKCDNIEFIRYGSI